MREDSIKDNIRQLKIGQSVWVEYAENLVAIMCALAYQLGVKVKTRGVRKFGGVRYQRFERVA
jgi:hypothetical protein